MTRTGSPEARSWHEAGHAVVATVFGGEVRSVTIELEDDDLEGTTAIEWHGMESDAVLAASAWTALGGPLAELTFEDADRRFTVSQLTAWTADWNEVLLCAQRLASAREGQQALIRHWVDTTSALFADPELVERVARVADALHAHGTLDDVLFSDAIA